jgi:hypothetical protein
VRQPNIIWPSEDETKDIVSNTGLRVAEMEASIRRAILAGERLARVGLDRIAAAVAGDRSSWVNRWNRDEVLTMWFGRVDKANHAMDVHRRLETAYGRLSGHLLHVKVRASLGKNVPAENGGYFFSPDTFRLAASWFAFDDNTRGSIIIHELLHQWFDDQELTPGNRVYGPIEARQLAATDPDAARRSAANYDQYCLYLLQGDDDGIWEAIGGYFPSGAAVRAVSRRPDQVDAFVTGNNGVVYTSAWGGDRWSGADNDWWPIGGVFPPGAPIDVVARTPDNLDVFVTGNNGVVYTSAWSPGEGWSGVDNNWRPIGGEFPPAAPVSAVSRSRDTIDLFAIDSNGAVCTSYWRAGEGWSAIGDRWTRMGELFPRRGPRRAPAGPRPVTVVSRTPDDMDLFVTGPDGVVYTSRWRKGKGWSGVADGWTPIGGFFPPGARVSVVARTPDNLDAFITGHNGVVYTSTWRTGGTWSGVGNRWRPIGGVFPPGATVAAVARGADEIQAFVTGNDGVAYQSIWAEGSGWSGVDNSWWLLGDLGPAGAPPGAALDVVDCGTVGVFVTGENGIVYTQLEPNRTGARRSWAATNSA